jgi:2-oxoglutarate ferredoxin oxidoreductase subunit gamma
MKILFAGEGGQGVQVIAEILAKAAILESKQATYIPNFGVEQRGGISLAFVKIKNEPVVYPKFEKADILAVLSDRSWPRVKQYQDSKTKTIRGPAIKDGLVSNLPPKVWNIVVLGMVNKTGEIVKTESLAKAMEERFARQFKKDPKLRKLDMAALKGKQK